LQQQEEWGEMSRDKAQDVYLTGVQKFTGMLGDAIGSMRENVLLARPERKYIPTETTPAGLTRAAGTPDVVNAFQGTHCQNSEKFYAPCGSKQEALT